MLSFFKLHVTSLLISISIVMLVLILLPSEEVALVVNKNHKEITQSRTSGVLANLNTANQDVVDFLASIKNKKQLTLLGSSEFDYSPYASYIFFLKKWEDKFLVLATLTINI